MFTLIFILLPLLVAVAAATVVVSSRRTLTYKKRWQDALRIVDSALELGGDEQNKQLNPVLDSPKGPWKLEVLTHNQPVYQDQKVIGRDDGTLFYARNKKTGARVKLDNFWCDPQWRPSHKRHLSIAELTLECHKNAMRAVAQMNSDSLK